MKRHDLTSMRSVGIRDVPLSTRLQLTLYADMRRTTIANVLGEIAEHHRSPTIRDPLIIRMGELAFEGARVALLASQNENEPDRDWLIRGMLERAHRTIKAYAYGNGLTVAAGLEQMVSGYLQGAANTETPTYEHPTVATQPSVTARAPEEAPFTLGRWEKVPD